MIEDLQAVFIDRDGTLGGDGHFIHPKDFAPYSFSRGALNKLKHHHIKILALTNQHNISKGKATEEDFRHEFKELGFDDSFICPHNPADACSCHKPETGLLLEAAEKYHLDLTKTVVIGDVGSTDMLAAHRVGAVKVLVSTGWGGRSNSDYRHTWSEVEADYYARDLADAVDWVLKQWL
ncbi:HAD-IIIA family hydrolase [Alkalicoccobacillus porphyridii]|uniref:D,D-heptose 1,7-bisphosphate phosphatase n=1 Tax=Alkalicoccobacillus porphyridii TaxID=2597270 RepID=A0A554A247_9BACI|nr:HAD-IIIA family hydrolase [Alkalicoccobacillus porphyridii]TSB47760.1 HAD-IIIA family hydrolase [Alkalicoccobacillus porphyridii]